VVKNRLKGSIGAAESEFNYFSDIKSTLIKQMTDYMVRESKPIIS